MKKNNRNCAGFTFLECMVSLALFSIISYGIYLSIDGALGAFEMGKTKSELQEMGRKVLKKISQELRGSGIVETVSLNYPSVYEFDPDVGSRGTWLGSLSFNDTSITETWGSWQDRRIRNANRTSNELVFRLPKDLDGDGYLTDSITEEVEWGPEIYSFKIVKDSHGIYRLEKHMDGAFNSLLGLHVKKITFDAIAFDTTVKYSQVVTTIFMERKTGGGHIIRAALEGAVSLRNTKEL